MTLSQKHPTGLRVGIVLKVESRGFRCLGFGFLGFGFQCRGFSAGGFNGRVRVQCREEGRGGVTVDKHPPGRNCGFSVGNSSVNSLRLGLS